jgi:hypothetical protein
VAGNPAGSAQRALVCMINTGQPGLMLDDRQAHRSMPLGVEIRTAAGPSSVVQ